MAIIDDNNNIIKESREEILTRIKNVFLAKYPNLSFDTMAPETIWSELFTTLEMDNQDYIIALVNQLDLKTATGYFLDIIGNIRGVFRKTGATTKQNIQVITSGATTLYGIDQANNVNITPFTVSDVNNNKYKLVSTEQIVNAGTYNLVFQSKEEDAIQSDLNAINVIVNTTLNVVSVNNIVAPSSLGSSEESDSLYRTRIIKAGIKNPVGLYQTIYNQLISLSSVNSVSYLPNSSGSTVAGIPAGHVQYVIDGGTDNEIAEIFAKNGLIVSTYGSKVIQYTDEDGRLYTYKIDNPNVINLYIKVELTLINLPGYDSSDLKLYIVNNFTKNNKITIFSTQEIINDFIKDKGITGFATSILLSKDNITYSNQLESNNFKDFFVPVVENIIINITNF